MAPFARLRNATRAAGLCLALSGSPVATFAAAEVDTTLAIQAALVDADRDTVPDRLGGRVTVRGVVTGGPVQIGEDMALVNFEDDTAGLVLITRDPAQLVESVSVGDELVVSGVVAQYQGAEQLVIEEFNKTGRRELPEPPRLSTVRAASEHYSGRRVSLSGELIIPDRIGPLQDQVSLRDAGGTIPVFLPDRFYDNPKFLQQLLASRAVDIVGVVGQADTEPPFDSGYRLIPLTPESFTFHAGPPYRELLAFTFVALLIGGVVLLWRSRRRAQLHAEQLGTLARELETSAAALRENQVRLRLLTEQVPAIVWTVDKSLRFTSSTGAGLKALHVKPDGLVGLNLFEFFQTDDADYPPIVAHRRGIAGESVTFETRWANRAYECHIEPLRDASGEIVGTLGLALDLTERRKAENALKKHSESTRHAQKMEAVGRFAGGVAHDFNNLVTVIKGYCDLIALKLGPDHDLQDWFDEIKNSANRASDLTGQLLAFSRKQMFELRVLNLNEVLADMHKLLHRIIGEHIELVTRYGEIGNVKVDKSQIEQVVMNLAVNAFDAMPSGGTLTIETRDATVRDGNSGTREPLADGRYVVVSVVDTGCGMTAETLSRVFEPFFTTKETGKGTGLGLATVYGIVSQSGGTIDVQSTPGRGTRFEIFLPVSVERVQDRDVPAITETGLTGDETVLVAEDEEAVRNLIRHTLEGKGYRVLEARNGIEALTVIQEYAGRIDLLVTDVVMPKMSGFTLARQLSRERPSVRVLFVSGYASNGRQEGWTIPPDAFLSKPFSPDALAAKVRKLLEQKDAGLLAHKA